MSVAKMLLKCSWITLCVPADMASGATPVIHVCVFRCITCIEIQVYYMCRNTGVLHV